MTTTRGVVSDRLTATADPPPTGIANPIHDADGADAAGYAGALVAGVRTYGWAVQTIVRALGDGWLDDGWVDFSLRRPLFAGEELEVALTRSDERVWSISCTGRGRGGERVVLDGTAALGPVTWLDELTPPAAGPGQDPPAVRSTYDLESVPLHQPLRPLRVHLKAETARELASDDLGIGDSRYADGDRPRIHPFFLAGRMAPLTRHNFTYGPTIHVRSQIQHRAVARAGQDITVGAQIVDAYDRNDHWYQVLDGVVSDADNTELARIRHHTIFRPRGTAHP